MNVTVEDVSAIRKKLIIEVAAEQVATEIEAAYKKIAKTADIKGFRKGHVPPNVLERKFGDSARSAVSADSICWFQSAPGLVGHTLADGSTAAIRP